MKKIFLVFFALIVFSLSTQTPISYALGECTATITSNVEAGEQAMLIIRFNHAFSNGQFAFNIWNNTTNLPEQNFSVQDRSSVVRHNVTINNPGTYHARVYTQDGRSLMCQSKNIEVSSSSQPASEEEASTETGSVTLPTSVPTITPTPSPGAPPPPCKEGLTDPNDPKSITSDPKFIKKCTKVDSAIGGIETNPGEFVKRLFILLLSMGGGWAVYLIVTAGYQLMFSGSNPEGIQEARDKITSAIVGLIFMILSVAILQIIGADIFQFPGITR